jgi:chemotaxis protein methyltransferase CheR
MVALEVAPPSLVSLPTTGSALPPMWALNDPRDAIPAAYAAFAEARLGLRLSDHQLSRVDALAAELAARTGHAGPLELLDALRDGRDAALLDELIARLVIGETHFFRVRPQIEALRRTIFPDLIGRRASERRLRVWSAGCSTGEEPYTLAILLREQLPATEEWQIDLVGSDLNPAFLEAARAGLYGDWSFRETPAEVREQYFSPEGRRWRLSPTVRRMVRFCQFNLMQQGLPAAWPEGAALDLILCRNVTIYFGPETTQELYARFARALAPGGWLVVGPSDPVPSAPDLLEPVTLPGAILWRRRAATPERDTRTRGAVSTRGAHHTVARPSLGRVFASTRHAARTATGGAPRASIQTAAPTGPTTPASSTPPSAPEPTPPSTSTHLAEGLRALETGDHAAALEHLRRATFLDSQDALAHFALGRAYAALGQRARARAAAAHARRLVAGLAEDHALEANLAAADVRRAVDALLVSLEPAA